MNSTHHTGRLCSDPELKQTPAGVPVCTFTLAVKRPRVKDKTDFIDFVAWRSNAEFISRYFHKGDPIEVSGVLTSRKFQDKNGNNRVAYEIECDTVEFPLTNGKAEIKEDPQQGEPELPEVDIDEDLPF